jgi:hypothetical protein
MAFHRIHFLAKETPSSKSLNHFNEKLKMKKRNINNIFIFHFLIPSFFIFTYLCPMNRSSFRSQHYPTNTNRFTIVQNKAMTYYAAIALVIMLGVVAAIAQGGGEHMLLIVVIAAGLGVFFANGLANASLRRTYAQINFVGDHFSLISVHDVISNNENHAFPLRYAAPSRLSNDHIQLHYGDQVITLQRSDWEDFDIIWAWLVAAPAA